MFIREIILSYAIQRTPKENIIHTEVEIFCRLGSHRSSTLCAFWTVTLFDGGSFIFFAVETAFFVLAERITSNQKARRPFSPRQNLEQMVFRNGNFRGISRDNFRGANLNRPVVLARRV